MRDKITNEALHQFNRLHPYDGWRSWEGRIETKIRRCRSVYRWVLASTFVSTTDQEHGWWTKELDKAVRRGTARLQAKARVRHEVVE